MKKSRILMGALALVVMVVAVIACSKEKEQKIIKQTTEDKERNPIASIDNVTGQMTYYFDLTEIQQTMNDDLAYRTNQDKYIIESVLIEDSLPADRSVNPEIRITVFDTEEEVSYTMWFMENFVDKEVKESGTEYYKDSEVAAGTYDFAYRLGDNYYITSVNGGEITTSEADSSLCMGMIKWFFVCLQQGCGNSCEKGGTFWNGHCEPCTTSTGQCNQNIAPWVVPAITIVGSFIINSIKPNK